MTKNDPDSSMTFENALEQLESLVERLEDGETPLEESIQAYVKGMELVRYCMKTLERAEKTLKQLTPQGEGFELIDAPLPDGNDDHDHA